MSSVSSKLAQALVPLLTVTLLAVGCDESTAPSSGETAASQPAAQPPADPSGASAGSGQVPTPAASEAPKVSRGNPLDTATSGLKPSFLRVSNAKYNLNWTTGMPTVRVRAGTVGCLANLVGRMDIVVSATGGKSIVFNQYVVGETWFYGSNGGAWKLLTNPAIRSDLSLHGGMLAAPFGTVPTASLGLVRPGYYTAVTRLTWYIRLNDGRWVWTATADYGFDRASDYTVGAGATAGPGYCKVP